MKHSAEWLRGAVESHINTCNLITSITSATTSHPARQGLVAAGKELHDQLDCYRALLAEAEAREASVPMAAEVIAEAKKALARIADHICDSSPYEVCIKNCPECLRIEALAAIAKWKEAQ